MNCRVENCEREERVSGLCQFHYQRQYKGIPLNAPMMGKSIPLTEKLKNIVITVSGCWEYQGNRDKNGYGRIKKNGKRLGAHVVSYEIHKGQIENGLCICHTCDNPPCINPEHLFKGTHKENSEDAIRKGRLTPMAYVRSFLPPEMQETRLTSEQLTQIRSHVGDLRDVAAEIGISRRYAYKIRSCEKLKDK